MKKQVLVASALMFSVAIFAQKAELKTAQKALKSGNAVQAKNALASIASIENADAKYKAQYYFFKGQAFYKMATDGVDAQTSYATAIKALTDLVAFEKTYKKKYTPKAQELLDKLAVGLVDQAIKDNEAKNYKEAAQKLYAAYTINPENNQDYLYFAASSAVNGQDYDTALSHYTKLKELKYTGVETQYFATNKATGEKEQLSKRDRDLFVKTGSYIKPEDKTTASRFPEIIKNIALIYSEKGETEKAVVAVKEAREANPSDVNLLLTEANLYIQLGQKDKFKALLEEAIAKDPNNATLYFNLGVINAEQKNNAEAKKYYEKAIALDPTNAPGYLNMAALILSEESDIVKEMNSLGNSRKDNARYDVLKAKRESVYRDAIPYLEKVIGFDAKNVDAVKTLMNIYGSIGENQKYKEMKQMYQALK